MLHRRTNTAGSSSFPSPSAAHLTPPKPNTSSNTAYKPLRRESSNFYPAPSSSSPSKPRYSIPNASPGLHLNVPGQNGYYNSSGFGSPGYGSYGYGGGTYDLSDSNEAFGMFGMFGGAGDKEDWAVVLRKGMENLKKGFGDASRLDKSVSLVWGDRELRTLVLKSTLINLVSLLLLSISPMVFSTRSNLSPLARHRTESVGLWYNVLLSWPVFVVCFWINSSWAPVINKRALTVLHPAYRHQPSPSSPFSGSNRQSDGNEIVSKIFLAIQRILLISDFTLVSRVLARIPIIGHFTAMAYMCIIDAYYAFDPTFGSKGYTLDRKVNYMQERIAYMIGFGFPATLVTSFGPQLVTMAIFALIYPFFVIQALLARPPHPKNSLLPATPSPQSSLPASPDGSGGGGFSLNGPIAADQTIILTPRKWELDGRIIPIFALARYALIGVAWLQAALLRDRGGSRRVSMGKERAGKRLG